MPSELVWLPAAAKDVLRLRDFIQSANPAAARRAAKRIKEAAERLRINPASGRPLEDAPRYRELLVPFGDGNYVLRYRQEEVRVVIVRVRHSKEGTFS